VDNLSHGRVELAFASGWHDRDFVFQPQNWENRRDVLMAQIEEVKRLWRGESIERLGGEGTPHEVSTLPRPVQAELPIFVTAAGSPDTYQRAGASGAHLLTHLLGQSPEELGEKIKLYREAWAEAGHEGTGRVSVMMHTFVGEDLEEVRELVRNPFRDYLRTALGLIAGLAKGRGQDIRSADFTEADMEALLDHAFDRYFQTSALLGTPQTTTAMVEKVKKLDADEIACLIDFGIPEDRVLESLHLLHDVHLAVNPDPALQVEHQDDLMAAERIQRDGITHLQCTPSYAEILLEQPGGREALAGLQCLMVGGEALPLSLARELDSTVGGRVLNMYGPTETTIWSSTSEVDGDDALVSLGRPIVNTDLYIMDAQGHPTPIGVPGELWIGGKGVVRGYWNRPELTAERFVSHPVHEGERVYRTGDLVRYRSDGRLDFLGRLDHQVKVRGHRIELGEIETLIRDHANVREAVVVAREDVPGDKRLVGYVVPGRQTSTLEGDLKDALRVRLPEWMVPQHIVALDALPLNPNGKTDRKALPAPELGQAASEFVEPESDLEKVLAEVWQQVLRRPSVGTQDNFFDLGGHSLLTVQVQARLRERTGQVIPITDLFRFPTIRALADHLSSGGDAEEQARSVTETAAERAAARRGAVARRRNRTRN
jgi:natural product biosynthesis luciferase-like monooxygenase protein